MTGRKLMGSGAALVLLGLLTGLVSPGFVNPRMGLSSHLAGLSGGTLLIALGAGWTHVVLPAPARRAAGWLLGLGFLANWLATLLAALWGAGDGMMPLASGDHVAAPWQEAVVAGLLIALSLAVIAGMALVCWGLARRDESAR